MRKKTDLTWPSRRAIGVIGLGYVGGSLQNWFERQKENISLFLYDKFKKIGSLLEVNKADIIFIAVPTPFVDGKGYDISAVSESVKNIKNGKTIVIKSSILPGTTDAFQKKYPEKTILFNPEFLRAKTALEDFLNPDKQLIGYSSPEHKTKAKEVLNLLPRAPFQKILPAIDAEVVKFFQNSYLAARVIFANQIYDLCEKIGADYATVKDCVVKDKRIGDSHFDIFHDGYRGYGGLCLPKDTRALLQFAKLNNIDLSLLKTAHLSNQKLLKSQSSKNKKPS